MKKFMKMFLVLFAILSFSATACKHDAGDGREYGLRNFPGTLELSGQVWELNYNTGKLSQIYIKFAGNRDVKAILELPYNYPAPPTVVQVGSGEILNGVLNLSISALDDQYLLHDGEDILWYIFQEWYTDDDNNGFPETSHISINDPNAKGNIITLTTVPAGTLVLECFLGAYGELSSEYVHFIYVDRDCKITADTVKLPGPRYTYNAFEIELKAGWNTVHRTETYNTAGDSSYSVRLQNPLDLRWVLWPVSVL